MKTVDLNKVVISDDILSRIPVSVAKRNCVLPLYINNGSLVLAMANLDYSIIDQIEMITTFTVEPVVIEDTASLTKALQRYYPDLNDSDNAPATNLLEKTLNKAMQLRVSDIHLNPLENMGEIKFRIDGNLRTIETINNGLFNELVTILKVMAHLDIAERRTPLDGNINTSVSGEALSIRIATMPTIYGEKLTLRLLSKGQNSALAELHNLGMSDNHTALFKSALNSPHGIILLSGPTGSGKTTSLYAALRYLRENNSRHLVSIEDPVEVPVDGVTQIAVDSDKDRLGFAKALRGVLRHDPDVIMVGEIRDSETADIAVKAALTGHLVIATLHANDSIGVVSRMIDLGVSPFLLASTLRLTIAQRLVRQPCPHCISLEPPTQEQSLALESINYTSEKFPVSKGCPLCGDTGCLGRIGIYEMISPDDQINKMIRASVEEEHLYNYIFNESNKPSLLIDGVKKADDGLISLNELIKATIT